MPARPPKVLVVDDELQIRTLLKATLARAGYSIVEASNAREALASKSIDKPDLVLLDLGLPDRDGLELVGALSAEPRAAVLVISARDQTEQKVAALDLGADDYVTKPFDTEELLARVRASLRQRLVSETERQVVDSGEVSIDLLQRVVRRGGDDVHVTPKEWDLLAQLAKHPGRVLTHQMLLRSVWGAAHVGQTEYLRVAIRSLRQKLEAEPSRPKLIVNEPGIGYRLVSTP
ncbi:MAG TPA: response regulator transcription factor [Sphingomicrobium sp.]|jgi:two-component system KDP operon response regulator KdpE|nr:response regulator transcription factor [Sphingomicrobium sp.]